MKNSKEELLNGFPKATPTLYGEDAKNILVQVFDVDDEKLEKIKKRIENTPIMPITSEATIEPIMQCYNMIADVDELKWFFDHVIYKPQVNESYSAVFVSRHKKLTKEEQATYGLTRKESEFLSTVTFKNSYITEKKEDEWTFDKFLKTLRKFNVDKYAYTTSLGQPIPEKTLAVVFYVNPCDDVTVADELATQIQVTKTALSKALLGGKTYQDCREIYRTFSNLENNLKHLKAHCKGSGYWMDFDVDVPKWFKYDEWTWNNKFIDFARAHSGETDLYNKYVSEYLDKHKVEVGYYYKKLCQLFTNTFGKGNYVIVDTSGGYHILVRTSAIKSNPHDICKKVTSIYSEGIANGEEPYLDEKGNCKFECVITASNQKFDPETDEECKTAVKKLEDLEAQGAITQREFKVMRRGLYDSLKTAKENYRTSIPGIPLPGTFQYNRPVTVLNKEDFE